MKILKIMKKSMTPSWIFNKNCKYEHKSSQKAQHYDYDNKYNFLNNYAPALSKLSINSLVRIRFKSQH